MQNVLSLIVLVTSMIQDALRQPQSKMRDDLVNELSARLISLGYRIQDELLKTPTTRVELNYGEESMILRGEYVQAIKSVRERTGLGLKEAKDVADGFRERNMYKDISGSWHAR